MKKVFVVNTEDKPMDESVRKKLEDIFTINYGSDVVLIEGHIQEEPDNLATCIDLLIHCDIACFPADWKRWRITRSLHFCAKAYEISIFEESEKEHMKQNVVFDFDGVIHSYTSGWKGEDIIPDQPVKGIKEAIDELRVIGYNVVVVSTRCSTRNGYDAIEKWLDKYNIEVDSIQSTKPPAICYIDDRAICFDGHPETLLDKVMNFKPWNK